MAQMTEKNLECDVGEFVDQFRETYNVWLPFLETSYDEVPYRILSLVYFEPII